jgi:hypothetical protein
MRGSAGRRPWACVALAAAFAALVPGFPSDGLGMETSILGPDSGIPDGRAVTSLLVSGNRLYVGTLDRGIVVRELGTEMTRTVTRAMGLPSDEVRSLALFQGKVYAGTSAGVGVEEGGRWTSLTRAREVTLKNVYLATSPDGKELWAAALTLSGGIVRFDGKEWKFMGGEGRGLFNDVDAFAFFPGGLLMGTISGSVYLRRGEEIAALPANLPGANVFAVGERGGTFYAGTNRGLFVWRGERWDPADIPEPVGGGKAIYAIARSDVDLFGGALGGLALLDRQGRRVVMSGRDGFPEGAVTALAVNGGVLYAGTERGVAVVKGWRE